MLLDKTAGLANDANGDGQFGPGDEIRYEVAIANAGALPFANLKVTDAIPPGTTYVPNSTHLQHRRRTDPDRRRRSRGRRRRTRSTRTALTAPAIQPGQTGRIRYDVKISNPYPAAAGSSITNLVKVDGPEEDGEDKVTIPLVTSDLSLDKVLANPAPTYLGRERHVPASSLRNDGPDAAEASS